MKKTIVPFRTIKLNNQGVHLLIKCRINGKSATMLIDTGASNTVFDKTRFDRFMPVSKLKTMRKMSTGLGTNSMISRSGVVERIELGTLRIPRFKAMVLDLSHVNASYQSLKLKPIDGVLGGDILNKYKGVINYGNGTLELELPEIKKSSAKKK